MPDTRTTLTWMIQACRDTEDRLSAIQHDVRISAPTSLADINSDLRTISQQVFSVRQQLESEYQLVSGRPFRMSTDTKTTTLFREPTNDELRHFLGAGRVGARPPASFPTRMPFGIERDGHVTLYDYVENIPEDSELVIVRLTGEQHQSFVQAHRARWPNVLIKPSSQEHTQ